MTDWFMHGGFPMWFILGSGLAGLALAADAGRKLLVGSTDAAWLRAEIDGVLFWGGFAAVLGLIGTLVGVALMARSLELSGSAPADVVWGGIRVALIPSAFGLSILALSAAMWFGLSAAYRKTADAGTGPAHGEAASEG